MCLLNLNTLELKDFIDSQRPPYVILSHTWGAEEVSLQELHDPSITGRSGYIKIRDFCRKGRENGFEWGWVDTCCIDKTSSAELSEAINSMYRWYQDADSCYAYLSDVGGEDVEREPGVPIAEQFKNSRWFTRGWTLQELLAPSSVVFYLNNWTVYGTKSSMHVKMTRITGIPIAEVMTSGMRSFSAAQKISWASRRETTRPEDLSYCLLGILGVNMPLLYGEGTRAFTRLQEVVMKEGADPTIFAWPSSALPPHTAAEAWEGPLAPSPSAFRNAGKHEIFSQAISGPWSLTNRGIRIEGIPMVTGSEARALLRESNFRDEDEDKDYEVALIGCSGLSNDGHGTQQLGIVLYKEGTTHYRMRKRESLIFLLRPIKSYTRVNCIMQLESVVIWQLIRPIQRRKDNTYIIRELPKERYGFKISGICEPPSRGSDPRPVSSLKELNYNFQNLCPHRAIIFSKDDTKEEFFVVVRVVNHEQPWITIWLRRSVEELPENLLSIQRGDLPRSNKQPYVDRTSGLLQGGNQVIVSVVRGIREGKRVSFIDISIRESPLLILPAESEDEDGVPAGIRSSSH